MTSMKGHPPAGILTSIQFGINRSLTPFLYQTKTLSSTRSIPRITSRSDQSQSTQHRRCLHASGTSLLSEFSPSKATIPVRRVLAKGRTDNISDGHTASLWTDDRSDLDRVRQDFPTKRQPDSFDNDKHFDDLHFVSDSDPFTDEEMFGDVLEDSTATSEPNVRYARESTITIAEREAFQRIFADIMARSKSTHDAVAVDPPVANDQEVVLTKPSLRRKRAAESVGAIMEQAIKESNFGNLSQTKTVAELKADIDQYPLPLRAAAAQALGFSSGRSTWTAKDEIPDDVDRLEQIRQPERERVEELMRHAKTDVELWQVMEREVFPLIKKLGLGETPEVQHVKSKPQRRKRKKVTKKEDTAESSTYLSSENETSFDLAVYAPLYPSHVLLGLRLLDRSFEKPSQLVLNVLPRVKSLGIVSHVLGASTALYNELIRIYWSRYDDFLGASALLKEMENAGLEFDEETLNVVNEINAAQINVIKGNKGGALQALWSLPEFAPGKFRTWKEKIQEALEERRSNVTEDRTWKA